MTVLSLAICARGLSLHLYGFSLISSSKFASFHVGSVHILLDFYLRFFLVFVYFSFFGVDVNGVMVYISNSIPLLLVYGRVMDFVYPEVFHHFLGFSAQTSSRTRSAPAPTPPCPGGQPPCLVCLALLAHVGHVRLSWPGPFMWVHKAGRGCDMTQQLWVSGQGS